MSEEYYNILGISKNDHSEHHTNTKKNSYAAPLINIDNLIEDLSK